MGLELEVRHDVERRRFVVPLEGGEAYLAYAAAGEGRVDYRRTFVPEVHREAGVGTALVRRALEWARDSGHRVVPTCPFVSEVVERHPEYADVLG